MTKISRWTASLAGVNTCTPVCLPLHLYTCLPLHLYTCLSASTPVHLSVCLYTCTTICLLTVSPVQVDGGGGGAEEGSLWHAGCGWLQTEDYWGTGTCLSTCLSVSVYLSSSTSEADLITAPSSSLSVAVCLTCLFPSPVCLSGEENSESRRRQHSPDGGSDSAEGAVCSDVTEERPVS